MFLVVLGGGLNQLSDAEGLAEEHVRAEPLLEAFRSSVSNELVLTRFQFRLPQVKGQSPLFFGLFFLAGLSQIHFLMFAVFSHT